MSPAVNDVLTIWENQSKLSNGNNLQYYKIQYMFHSYVVNVFLLGMSIFSLVNLPFPSLNVIVLTHLHI